MSRPADEPGALRAVVAAGQAAAYVTARTLLRQVRGTGRRPWAWLGLLLAVVVVAAGQWLLYRALAGDVQPSAGAVGRVIRYGPLLVALLLLNSAESTPFRFSAAEVSWLLTAPGGGRALVARHLLARPLRYAVVGFLGGAAARWWVDQPPMGAWRLAVAGVLVALALNLIGTGRHLLTVRLWRRQRALAAIRIAAAVWAAAMVASWWITGWEWVRLEPAVRRLVLTVIDVQAAPARWLFSAVGALMVASALLVAGATRFEEYADRAARQAAVVEAAVVDSHSAQDLASATYRTGMRSLRGARIFRGEAVLAFRALAQERRRLVEVSVLPGLAVAVTVALVYLLPGLAWIPVPVIVLNLVSASTMESLAVELDHHHLRLAPLRPVPALVWVSAVPVLRSTVILEALWLPHLATPVVDVHLWATGAVLAPVVAVVLVAAGNLATIVGRSMLSRHLVAAAVFAGSVAAAAVPLFVLDLPTPELAAGTAAILGLEALAVLGCTASALSRRFA